MITLAGGRSGSRDNAVARGAHAADTLSGIPRDRAGIR